MPRVNFAILVLLLGTSVVAAAEPLRDVIDREVAKAWAEKGLEPAARSTDAVFLRRVHLDLVGTIPTHDEAVAFLDDTSPDKREKLIDRLLADPRFGRKQGDEWDMVLFGRNPAGYDTRDRPGFQKWIAERFNDNTPYDVWAAAVLKAEGNSADHGAPLFLVQYDRRPLDAAVAVSKIFLGVQLECARCHDHPFEDYTQLDFYGMAAFYERLRKVDLGTTRVGVHTNVKKIVVGERNTGEVLFSGAATDQTPGKKGEAVAPKFMQGDVLEEPELPEGVEDPKSFPAKKVPPAPHFSRKDALADWITSPENPWFAKAVANRIWAQYMGRGLVDPVDNLAPSNPPSHPELLDALAAGLIEHDFDLKWFIREITSSRTYQLGHTGSVVDARPRWFERARTRPLSAEELADAWRVATDYLSVRPDAAQRVEKNRFDPLTSGFVLRFFGKPNNGVGDFQGGLSEHLYFNNGQVTSLISTSKGGLYDRLAGSEEPWEQRVERLFLTVLSRRPKPAETERFVAHLAAEDDQQDRLREAIWALMTCSEFRFNH